MKQPPRHILLLIIITMFFIASSVFPQSSANKTVKLTGEIGTFGELYSISGKESRRPSETARLFFKPRLTFFNNITMDFNFLLSTEGSSARQQINQFDFNPRWGWGEAHLGDFSQSYSNLTLDNIKIRGAALTLSPGFFSVSLVSGLVKRSVTNSDNRAYKRELYGAKIGFGNDKTTSFGLIVLTSKDRLDEYEDIAVIDTTETDSTAIDSTMSPEAVTPQENLVVSFKSNITLIEKTLMIQNEISGSAYTRDRRSSELASEEIPDFLTDLFVPRISTNADYAHSTEATLNIEPVSVKLGYKYIGPGYVSLGLASLINDTKAVNGSIMYRFRLGTVKLDGNLQKDNLADQKTCTTDRNRYNLLFNLKPVKNLTSLYMVNLATVKNDADTSTYTDYRNWIFRTSQKYNLGTRSAFQNVSFDYSYQKANESNPSRRTSNLSSHSFTIQTVYRLTPVLYFTPLFRIISTNPETSDKTAITTYSLTARHTAMQRKLTSLATLSLSDADASSTWKVLLRGAYRLKRDLNFSLELGMNFFRTDDANLTDHDEFTARLKQTYNF